MALNFPDNRYPGVNAHLNSYLHRPNGTWSSFHVKFANAIQEALDSILPPNYYASLEQGLQISAIGSTPTAILPLTETTILNDEDDLLIRIGVYKSQPDDIEGKLVTAIEILSPANKPKRKAYRHYSKKRTKLLFGGVNLVEIDLFHELPPVTDRIPSYVKREPDAHAFNIIVSIPYPDVDSGKITWYGFDTDNLLPTVLIPLIEDESLPINLTESYNRAFKGMRLFSLAVDYEKLPVNFERYSATDQQRIKDVLDRIRKDIS